LHEKDKTFAKYLDAFADGIHCETHVRR